MFDKITEKMFNIILLILCLVATNINHKVEGIQSPLEEDLELERELKHINKLPVKSIHLKSGYIVDCVDIKKQPAFDHPLLKNHTLQLKPNFQKIMRINNEKNSSAKPFGFGLEKNQCPIGTIPIRRITKEYLKQGKSLFNNHILTSAHPGSHVAEVTYGPFLSRFFYGVSGINSVWNPRVNHDQSSSSHMWVQNGQGDGTNKITVGWHVSPQLYGDYQTHIYATWTSDNFKKTGCYNVLCQGFVQIDTQHHLGQVGKTSIYNGVIQQFQVTLSQDPITKNWWVISANKNIGYFPAALFTNMESADQVGWGGGTTTPAGTLSPPMGSGHFPDNNIQHAGSFKYISYQDTSRNYYGPAETLIKSFTDQPNCFSVEYYGNQVPKYKYSLNYGGPGGFCGN